MAEAFGADTDGCSTLLIRPEIQGKADEQGNRGFGAQLIDAKYS